MDFITGLASVTDGGLVGDGFHSLNRHGLVVFVHGPGTQAGECEESNAVQEQTSQQDGQDHIPEPNCDEHLQQKLK
ncbi:hypothetical protein E2C01_006022 [Portunus trituberculatus]|uniref:Uncharacterized protein n=1 Tax=Portunus trituberculatus TaxID=210409 RepID=A0A5B7CX14_PORTR|nr:hypothetical protein [Portunus trituberculatus]